MNLRTEIAAPAEQLLAWLERPGTAERLAPPWSADKWVHTHQVSAAGDGCVFDDAVEGENDAAARVLAYRARRVQLDLARHAAAGEGWRVAVTGASGLVGKQLCAFLQSGGHEVLRLGRDARGEIAIGAAQLDGIDALVHLAGENVAARWSDERKKRIRDSRVQGTKRISETLASLAHPPRVLVCASAIGIYGDAGGEFDESGPLADDFLASVCKDWEAACEPARKKMRVVNTRFGVVLTPAGGALGKLLPPFRMGAGGRIGNGKQMMSWVALDDVIYAIHRALSDERLEGPINLVSPNAVSNAEFATILGRVLHRPSFMPLPAPMVNLMFGEMGRSMLLGGATVRPRRLLDAGFTFSHPELEPALKFLLGRATQ